MINIQHITRSMKKRLVLQDITLQLPSHKIYGFAGRNGSGKTMLFRAILGLIHLDSGTIHIDEIPVDPDHIPQSVGFLLENPSFLPDLTGFENLSLIASIRDELNKEQLEELLSKVGLSHAMHKPFRAYSLGMKQRLGIACAMMGSPKYIFLDEPTIALDEAGIKELHHLLLALKENGATVFIASHEKEILEDLADEVFYLEQGRLIEKEDFAV